MGSGCWSAHCVESDDKRYSRLVAIVLHVALQERLVGDDVACGRMYWKGRTVRVLPCGRIPGLGTVLRVRLSYVAKVFWW